MVKEINGHNIIFDQFDEHFKDVLTRQDVIDAIDIFFDGPDTIFWIVGFDSTPGRRGSCMSYFNGFKITLSLDTISEHIERGIHMGGNKPHTDLKLACLSVLAHEIQHANQARRHSRNSGFYKGEYISRPCERDARNFADNNEDVIENIINCRFKPKTKISKIDYGLLIHEIIDVFSMIDGQISLNDIISELKIHDANNPVNVSTIVSALKKCGKIVVKC